MKNSLKNKTALVLIFFFNISFADEMIFCQSKVTTMTGRDADLFGHRTKPFVIYKNANTFKLRFKDERKSYGFIDCRNEDIFIFCELKNTDGWSSIEINRANAEYIDNSGALDKTGNIISSSTSYGHCYSEKQVLF